MRAAVFHGRSDLRLEDVPEPAAGPGEVKLRVLYNGICGSDLHEVYDGPITTRTTPHPLTGIKNPVILGHELSGEVVEVGAGVEDLEVGDRVAVEPVETCGTCMYCTSGAYNHCGLLAFHGYNRASGGLAQFSVVKRSMAHKLPKTLTGQQGALIEPMAISYRTAERCEVEAGQTVAIHGGGPIGIGIFFTLAKRGVRVIMVDPSPQRRAALVKLGVPVVLDPRDGDIISAIKDFTSGRGADTSVDAAGVPAAFKTALLSTAVGGQLIVVAIHTQPLQIAPMDMLMTEVRVSGIALSNNTFPKVIAEMSAGTYPMEGWVETVPFERLLVDGFERLRRQDGLKILVDVGAH
ncbi:MAG TPA: alcohol dehydrogenase catalytic domain-containing protein [Steroidobacteraceae bacterium]|jgi:(R,R)-butanediol dehydrogenase/meso-butanediol dehydrogenase/diacetyl reductase|nr:alcohol dehydrogenase catalytic domain-containing protein [Steroidobacteraceae bacterium]